MSWFKDFETRYRRSVWKEAGKQAVDQTLHFAWAAATTFFPFLTWAMLSAWGATIPAIAGSLGSAVVIVVREVKQWPSSRWWDPWLDWLFYVIGGVFGLYHGINFIN